MIVYVDIVLIENLIMNYIILFTTGLILKQNMKHIRLIIAGLIGAIYAVITYVTNLPIYSSIILKILLSIFIVYVAYNPQNVKRMWKCLLIFYLTSFLFGGIAFSLIYIVKPQNIIINNGKILGTYTIKMVILGAVIGFFIIITSFKIVKNKITKEDMFCELEIKLNGNILNTKAMIDSGNLLKEPITNTPVIVVEHTILFDYLPKEILNNLDNILGGDFENVSEEIKENYISKLKFIPFSSLGKQNGMLIGIKPEYVKIIQDDKEVKIDNIIIGIYNKSLTKKGEYRALASLEMLG